jgi:hypothetical protein
MEAHFVARRHAYWGARWRTPTGIAVALYVFGDSRWFEPLRRLDSSITNSRTLRSADPNRSHIHDERLRVCVLGQKSVFCGSLSSICRARTRPTTVSTGILCFELFQPSRIVRFHSAVSIQASDVGLNRRFGVPANLIPPDALAIDSRYRYIRGERSAAARLYLG